MSSLVLYRWIGSGIPYSQIFPFSAFLLNSAYTMILSKTNLAYTNRFFPLGLFRFSYRPTLHHLPEEAFTSEYDGPIFLPSPDHIHKTILSFCTTCSTSSFVFMSLQLIFSIFLHTHISKASSLRIFSCYMSRFQLHIGSHTPHYRFDNSYLVSFFKILHNKSFLWLKTFIP